MNLEENRIQKDKKSDQMYNTETMLSISEIQEDTLILKDGGLRSIIKVEGMNLDLRNTDESLIVLEQYKRFINALDFPVQILIRNTYLDLTQYIDNMQHNVAKLQSDALKQQGQSYISFLENISLQQWLIFVKEFYIVIPYYSSGSDGNQINKPRRQKLLAVLDSKEGAEKIVSRYRWFVKQRKFIDVRTSLVIDGLRGIGLSAERLTMSRMVSLLFSCYNPAIHVSQADFVE